LLLRGSSLLGRNFRANVLSSLRPKRFVCQRCNRFEVSLARGSRNCLGDTIVCEQVFLNFFRL
jgi:hypothetical protein